MLTIVNDNIIQIIVLAVNILSLNKTQVNTGNTIYDAPNADKRTDQSSFTSP